jgi:hypothetical protein
MLAEKVLSHEVDGCDVIRITTQVSYDSSDLMMSPTHDVRTATSVHTRFSKRRGSVTFYISTYEVYRYDFKQPLVIIFILDHL